MANIIIEYLPDTSKDAMYEGNLILDAELMGVDIESYIDIFKAFLLAKGFGERKMNKYLGLNECDCECKENEDEV